MAVEDNLPDENPGKIVQWYDGRKPVLSAPVATVSILTAFTLGALAAVGALALVGRLRD
ncbi:MAG: hypothetical protein V4466_15840 [Pseudomonadota bacterium]